MSQGKRNGSGVEGGDVQSEWWPVICDVAHRRAGVGPVAYTRVIWNRTSGHSERDICPAALQGAINHLPVFSRYDNPRPGQNW